MTVALDMLRDTWGDDDVPPVDRTTTNPDQLGPQARHWRDHGWIHLPGLIPDGLIDLYAAEWTIHNVASPGGWDYCTPHRDHPALARLVTTRHIGQWLELLLDEPAGVHLTLTGWRTTTRDWHQDNYLNPPGVGGYYIAAWIALDDIHPDSGPFQFVDASHRWPPLSQAKVRQALGESGRGPDWPTRSEELLTPLFEQEIADQGCEVTTWLPNRGDVFLWHSRLLHRGSRANVPGMERRALIAHYSGVRRGQLDMPPAVPSYDGWMFPVDDAHGIPDAQLTGGA